MSRSARSVGPRAVRAAAVAALAVTLSGCFTGDRPVLTPPPTTTGDASADAVLQLLQNASAATFTANYTIATPLGEQAPAEVVQQGRARRSITIGNARFLVDGAATSTCTVDTDQCIDSIDRARISNLSVSPDFYDVSPAARLRQDVHARIGPTSGSKATIVGQPATCVTIPIAQTAARYCALDAGPLAELSTIDVNIELTAFRTGADTAAFARPAG